VEKLSHSSFTLSDRLGRGNPASSLHAQQAARHRRKPSQAACGRTAECYRILGLDAGPIGAQVSRGCAGIV